jgi:gas vesicle protein
MSKCEKESLVFTSGIILGAAVGATIGMLFAPGSGDEIRKKVAKKGKKLLDEAGKGAKGLGKKLEPRINELRKELDAKVEEIKVGLEQTRKELKEKNK